MIKCPYCGADYTHLHLDTLIHVSATVDEDGNFIVRGLTAEEVADRFYGGNINDYWFFCDSCGSEKIPADIVNDKVVPKGADSNA